jgi:phosphate transport system substrate-binding protein
MKKILLKSIALSLLLSVSLLAQERATKTVFLKGARFTYPLIEKWVTEYNKENLQLQINLVTQPSSGQESVLNVVAYQVADSDLTTNQSVSYVGKYALIPVSNSKNPIIAKAGKNGFSKKVLKKILFDEVDEYGDDVQKTKNKFIVTVYSRENQAPTTITLSRYFDAKPAELKGKKVLGDDIYLLNAIKKDSTGIAFNSLNYVCDIQSRKFRGDISLLPLNLKTQQKEILNTLDLDYILSLLEKNNVENIPVGKFGFLLSPSQRADKQITSLIKWILTNGQKFNHTSGFLNLDEETLTAQKQTIDEKYITSIK